MRSIIGAVGKRVILLLVAGVALNAVWPQVVDVFGSAPRLLGIRWWFFTAMAVTETASFAAAWALARLAVPRLGWFAAATSQLASNAASRIVPGGAVVGGAVYFQLLSRAGGNPVAAAKALSVTSYLSTSVLLALPAVAAIVAVAGAPIPDSLLVLAATGTVAFVVIVGLGLLALTTDAPLRWAARVVCAVARPIGRLFRREVTIDPDAVVERRNELVASLRGRWGGAVALAAANWLLDYATLGLALLAVGAEPRPSLVLLAYAAAAVLTMIPITPGGLGFVEVGLTATLTVAGVPSGQAVLATLAYRLFSYWLPVAAGGLAYLAHRRRYPAEAAA